jgi:mono/diheme cytochrome c family protein
MKRFNCFKSQLRAGLSLAFVAGAVYALSVGCITAADPKPEKEAKAEKKPQKKTLSGADLYAMHCNRCHPERYATEWNPAQWKTIILHMRVRANLPASQAKTILKYLQEDAGS